MTMNTIIGQVARGSNFFNRPKIINHIWDKLRVGSNLLLVAPRRVGKTSILFNLVDNPQNGFIVVYYTSESVNSEEEFFRKLYSHLLKNISSFKKYKLKIQTLGKDILSRIEKLGTEGIELGKSKISWRDELQNLIATIEIKERIIILIDEFSQTVENIIQDVNKRAAIHFLETKREIRQEPNIHMKLQFVYTGSIGLENIVSKINCINLINDLSPIEITPLSKSEANSLVRRILLSSNLVLSKNEFNYLMDVIEWAIPFYFQLLLDEANTLLQSRAKKRITKEIINQAVENALKKRIYFEQWYTRLRKAYSGSEFSFIKELLNITSLNSTITTGEILNLSIKYDIKDRYNDILNSLRHDGYINNLNNSKIYRFNSPLLKKWWYQNVTN